MALDIPVEILELMSDEEIAEAKRQDKERSLFVSDMRDIMVDTRVQKLIYFLLDTSNINGVNYTGDNNETNFNLGKTAVGYSLLELMDQVDPTLYPRLLLNQAKEKLDA